MARSSSNKGINKNKTNGSSYSTGRNPGGMVAGLTADTTYGEGQDIKAQVALTGGLPDASLANRPKVKKPFKPVDIYAPTNMTEQPLTDGSSMGPGRTSATLTPAEGGDLFLIALAEKFPTTDTMSLVEDNRVKFEI